MNNKITREKLKEKLNNLRDTNKCIFFSVKFTYRDNARNRKLERVGNTRIMNGAFNVDVYESGGPPAYDPSDKELFWCCDMQIVNENKYKPREQRPNPYRSIPWEGIEEIHINKEIFILGV